MRGNATPEIANCELLLEAEDTVTLLPVAVIVEDRVLVLPTSTFPNASELGLKVSWPAVLLAPLPVRGIVKPGPGRKTLPFDVPLADGAKVTFRVMLWPRRIVTGRAGPETVKPVPATWYAVSTTLELGLVTTTGRTELLPTFTCPNERLVGESVSGSPATPYPPTPICSDVLEAVLVTVTAAVYEPEVVGRNVMFKAALWPAARVAGNVSPDVLNAVELSVTAEILMLVPPVFVRVTVCVSD